MRPMYSGSVRHGTNAQPHENKPARGRQCRWVVTCAALLLPSVTATAQPNYTFTSGPTGDGFNWPASPTGLLDDFSFTTPDGVEFYNATGNNVFFDAQYQVVGNAPGIAGDALWGNPLDLGYGALEFYLYGYGDAQTVAFDLAWSVGGFPGATPTDAYVYLEDSEGRATEVTISLSNTFTGLGGFDGYSDHVTFDATVLYDDFFSIDGGPFLDISYLSLDVGEIIGGQPSEFGIDNFGLDGSSGGGGEVFPSVNGGTIDVTGATLVGFVLRGAGVTGRGFEVTNSTSSNTTYSTQLLPGGDLDDAGQVNGASINAGQTVYTGSIVSLDRSLASGEYSSRINVVNDLDPTDPNNAITLRVRLLEPPLLTAPSPVDVTAAEPVQLSNAADPVGGYRASVEVTGSSIVGPFSAVGLDIETPVKPGETEAAVVAFDRYGRLTGYHSGLMTVSLVMTAFAGINNDIEVFLTDAEPVPDEMWMLTATLADMPSDSAAHAASDELGPRVVGVNSVSTAATILAGTASSTGSVSMLLATDPGGILTGIVGDGVEVDFTTAAPVHVVQMTYREIDLCGDMTEGGVAAALLRLRRPRLDAGRRRQQRRRRGRRVLRWLVRRLRRHARRRPPLNRTGRARPRCRQRPRLGDSRP